MPSTAETLTDVVHSSKQIKVQGFSVTAAMAGHEVLTSGRWKVGGYDWEVQVLPNYCGSVAINLPFCSEVRTPSDVNANFSCRLIDPSGKIKPSPGISSTVKLRSAECRYLGALMSRRDLQTSGYLNDDAFTVECTLKVLRELRNKATAHRPADHLLRSSGLNHHLGELLRKGTGADVTLVASGESFKVHKAVLASRSPVFAAEFFGHMKEARSPVVEIEDMDAAVLGAMLRFIYTDTAPELDRPEDGAAVAQHLLVAADRYGIDRLKLVCEDRLYDGVNVETAAATLALAEQHVCSHLKAKCVELIAANLEAAMATEGYSHLMASCPSVMNDLLRAVHGRKN
ncbi:hypothetical protein PAHAL_4G050800 [Panicum hallii]|uniref:BTB domain-containing protein n=1 Tax=Panicum hallii TaxID=206008 RepID=A0A2T8JBU6_9POAL|nr:BTB/POZ and MATH domain-containing protein 2-like [Panicum hallii]PVH47394.1 hypothetical protein PAHAL_4G050800 [Panicum hallii]